MTRDEIKQTLIEAGLILAIFLGFAIIALVNRTDVFDSFYPTEPTPPVQDNNPYYWTWVVCREEIIDRMQLPDDMASGRIVWQAIDEVDRSMQDLGDQTYSVDMFVDVDRVRSNYFCKLQRVEDNWNLLELSKK